MDFGALATSLGTTVTGALTSVQPVVVIILGAVVGYALFKRFIASR